MGYLLSIPSSHLTYVVSFKSKDYITSLLNAAKCRLRTWINNSRPPRGCYWMRLSEACTALWPLSFTLSKIVFLYTAWCPKFPMMYSPGQETMNARMLENSFVNIWGRSLQSNLSLEMFTRLDLGGKRRTRSVSLGISSPGIQFHPVTWQRSFVTFTRTISMPGNCSLRCDKEGKVCIWRLLSPERTFELGEESIPSLEMES